MKNMIDPEKLARLMQKPPPFEEIAEFLAQDNGVTATGLCRLIGLAPQVYFNWKSKSIRRPASDLDAAPEVEPTGSGKKRYSAEDKFELLQKHALADGAGRAELLRRYGIYQSDVDRWSAAVKEAAMGALSQRKPRSDRRPPEQAEIQGLKRELRGQEKTIAKLAALVVIQKKVSEIMSSEDDGLA